MKKNLKLIMLLILLFIMSLSLFGCGGAKKKHSSDNGTGQQTGQEKPAEDKEKKHENEEELKPQKKMTDEEIAKIFEMQKESDGWSIKKYIDISGTPKNITVPGEYKGSKIKKIEDSAFRDTKINTITIPSTVTLIRKYAFLRSSITTINCKVTKSYVESNEAKFAGLLEKKDKINWVNG